MKTKRSKYIIIGAGLSGLITAYELLKNGIDDILVLEARPILGGRIHTKNGVDLGATWFQDHHTYLSRLLDHLNIKKFKQYSSGNSVLVYNTMAPAHFFESDTNGPSAYRIAGGSMALIERISESLKNKIHLNTKVKSISERNDDLVVETDKGYYACDKLIVTIPPKLLSKMAFNPTMSDDIITAMNTTHTWMSNAIKVGISFNTPFWRDKNLSGTIIGQIGPVIELYDHCCANDSIYTLMGFVNEGLRDSNAEDRKERILSYLETYLGKEVRLYREYFEKDWSDDEFTSCKNLKSIYMSPKYGNPIFEKWHMNGKLLFSGTETSPLYGGYLEGAVYSGLSAAAKLLNN